MLAVQVMTNLAHCQSEAAQQVQQHAAATWPNTADRLYERCLQSVWHLVAAATDALVGVVADCAAHQLQGTSSPSISGPPPCSVFGAINDIQERASVCNPLPFLPRHRMRLLPCYMLK